jgi:hypothetical protein
MFLTGKLILAILKTILPIRLAFGGASKRKGEELALENNPRL